MEAEIELLFQDTLSLASGVKLKVGKQISVKQKINI